MIGKVGGEASVKVGRSGLKMGGKSSILHGEVIVFLFIHLLVDHILFGNPQ